jgi:hypothetical protein
MDNQETLIENYKDLPNDMKNDRELALLAVEKDPKMFRYVSDELKTIVNWRFWRLRKMQ